MSHLRKYEDTVPRSNSTHVSLLCGRFFRSLSFLKSHVCVQSLGCLQIKNKTKQKKTGNDLACVQVDSQQFYLLKKIVNLTVGIVKAFFIFSRP